MSRESSHRSDVRSVVRQLVSEVLQDVLGNDSQHRVAIQNSDDLNRFVHRLLVRTGRDPQYRKDLLDGHVVLELIDPCSSTDAAVADVVPSFEIVVERGALTERIVKQAARERKKILCRRGVIVTPLAKELLRSQEVVVEVES